MLIRHLSYFVTLAREKHYARAAEICNIAQPTLSAAIRKLEEDLQVVLVVRGHRFMGLTPDGEKVLQWGRRILSDYDSLREGLSGSPSGLSGTLELGAVPASMPALPFLTNIYASQHPNVTINIQSMTSKAIHHAIETFEIDAGVTYIDDKSLEHVRCIPLYPERYIFVTRRGNRYADRSTITWAEAAEERLCLLSESMRNRRFIDEILASLGTRVNPVVVSNTFLGVYAHTALGNWSSIVPHTFQLMFGGLPDLCAVPLVEPEASQMLGLVLPNREPLSPIAGTLLSIAASADLRTHLA
jgi:DNA-binding transcriptional LysR family regulator